MYLGRRDAPGRVVGGAWAEDGRGERARLALLW